MQVRGRFRRDAHAVAGARRFVAAALTESGVVLAPEIFDGALLAVSELATNAIEHARSDFDVTVVVDGTIRISVHDDSPMPPVPRHAAPGDLSGRGMTIVDALCEAWGVIADPVGKQVWCELRPGAPAGS